MKIEIIDNINKFSEIESKWNKIYDIGNYTFFQSFHYNFYAWKNILFEDSFNKLNIILVYHEQTIVAICPFYIDKLKRLRFINDIHTDFCDILVTKKIEFNNVLKSLNFINSYSFINLNKNSHLLKIIDVNHFSYVQKHQSFYSYLNLEKGSFPQNHLILKSKQKSEFRRIAKKHIDSIHLVLSASNHTFPVNEINTLRNKMISSKIRKTSFLNLKILKLIELLYINNELIISMIKNDYCIQAISFVLKKDNNYLFWIDMYDSSKMINIFNYIKFISKMSSKKDVNIHFGRGDYFYKLNNFKPKIENLQHVYIFFNNLDLFYFKIKSMILNIIRKAYKTIIR